MVGDKEIMFEGQPKGLFALALANTGERFGYYTMLAVFVLFLQANFGFSAAVAGNIYAGFLAFVYFLPLVGGILADKFGYIKMATLGIFIMFLGYAVMALPAGAGTVGIVAMFTALAFICIGTGLFKGNLQVLVGNLYDNPKYADKRDSAFSLFYMAINIGAFFAPSTAVAIMKWGQEKFGVSVEDSYHFAFGVACVSLIFSILIYFITRSTYAHADNKKSVKNGADQNAIAQEELTPAETRARVIALCLVFGVVIFFWMAFHQNGLTLTMFARDYTATSSSGIGSMLFSLPVLLSLIFIVYASFSFFQSTTNKGRGLSGIIILASLAVIGWQWTTLPALTEVNAPIFQQFNPLFVVMLTPVSMAIFSALAKKGKEPKAPVKIGLGMFVAALGYLIMISSSLALPSPEAIANGTEFARVSPNWLISTYLVLTFAELLLSPMGISFVSKVAPPKMKGMMMGGWFVATAIGNYGTSLGTMLWGDLPLWSVWAAFALLCVLSGLFIFSVIKKLNKVA